MVKVDETTSGVIAAEIDQESEVETEHGDAVEMLPENHAVRVVTAGILLEAVMATETTLENLLAREDVMTEMLLAMTIPVTIVEVQACVLHQTVIIATTEIMFEMVTLAEVMTSTVTIQEGMVARQATGETTSVTTMSVMTSLV